MAKRTSTPTTRKLDELGLAHLFRDGSTTAVAAERLLTGRPITRQELVRETGVVETVVPRMVSRLQEAGIEVERELDPQTKRATYRALVPAVDVAPKGSYEFAARPGAEPTVQMTGMEARGDRATVRLSSPLGDVEGSTAMHALLAVLAKDGLPLCRVNLLPGGAQEWVLGSLPNTITITDLRYT